MNPVVACDQLEELQLHYKVFPNSVGDVQLETSPTQLKTSLALRLLRVNVWVFNKNNALEVRGGKRSRK